MGVNGGVPCESEVCMCSQAMYQASQAWSLSLIGPQHSPHDFSQLQWLIPSHGPGDWRPVLGSWSPGPPRGWPGGGCRWREKKSLFPGPITSVQRTNFEEAFTAGMEGKETHSLQEKIKATSAACWTVIWIFGGKNKMGSCVLENMRKVRRWRDIGMWGFGEETSLP